MNEQPKEYAGFWIRFASISIDSCIVWIWSVLVSIIVLNIMHPYFSTGSFLLFSSFFLLIFYIIAVFFYYSFLNADGRQTIGKKIFGIGVILENNQPLPLLKSLLRTVGILFDLLIFGLGHLIALFSKENQTLHDSLVKT